MENIKQDFGNSFQPLKDSTLFNSSALMISTAAVLFPEIGGPLLLAAIGGLGTYAAASGGKAVANGFDKAKLGKKIQPTKKNNDLLGSKVNQQSSEQSSKKSAQDNNDASKSVTEETKAHNFNKIIIMVLIALVASVYAPWAMPFIIGVAAPLVASDIKKIIGKKNKATSGIGMVIDGSVDIRHGKSAGLEKIITGAQNIHEAVVDLVTQKNVADLKPQLDIIKKKVEALHKSNNKLKARGIKKKIKKDIRVRGGLPGHKR